MTLQPFVFAIALLIAAGIGAAIVWSFKSKQLRRHFDAATGEWQFRLEKIARDKDQLSSTNERLQKALDAERRLLAKHKDLAQMGRTELQSFREKATTLEKELFTATEERSELELKLSRLQSRHHATEHRMKTLQEEFDKERELYNSQIEAAEDQRSALERKLDDGNNEHASLRNLLMASKAEHEAVSNMLETANTRLKDLEGLDQQIIAVQAENAELKQEIMLARQNVESLKRDATEVESLKKQNQELSQCLQSMEASRKQYEEDARRYREQYERSEQESDTLQIKLGEISKNWEAMRRSEEQSIVVDLQENGSLPPFGLPEPDGEPDDLTEIIGIGKIFAATLNKLGVYHFRQIAAFGATELAVINAELKEFRGRIEHDDWIGQAKELHFRKYGSGSRL